MDGCTVNMRTGLCGTTERTPLRHGRIHVLPCVHAQPCVIGPGTRAFARPGVVSCGRAPHSHCQRVTLTRHLCAATRCIQSVGACGIPVASRIDGVCDRPSPPRLRSCECSLGTERNDALSRAFHIVFLAATSASSPEAGGIGLGADPAAITSIPGKNYPKASPAVRLRPQPSRGNGTAGTHPRRLCRARSVARGLCR